MVPSLGLGEKRDVDSARRECVLVRLTASSWLPRLGPSHPTLFISVVSILRGASSNELPIRGLRSCKQDPKLAQPVHTRLFAFSLSAVNFFNIFAQW